MNPRTHLDLTAFIVVLCRLSDPPRTECKDLQRTRVRVTPRSLHDDTLQVFVF